MAMVKCKECGNQISSKAKACPSCGKPIKRTSLVTKFVLVVIVLPFLMPLCSSIFRTSSAPSESNSKTRSINKPVQKKPESQTTTNRQVTPEQKEEQVIDIRKCIKPEGIGASYVRTGPGMQYKTDSTGSLIGSDQLHVLEEKNGWIKFRVTPMDLGWSAWTRKDLTVSLKEIHIAREAKFGEAPQKSGWDGSVRIVKDYVRNAAKDPSSIEYDDWSDIYFNEDDGWMVHCIFRGKNSFGGYTKTAQWFVIRHGRILTIHHGRCIYSVCRIPR